MNEPKIITDPVDALPLEYFYYVDTEKASYRSSDLTRCMNLWKNSGDTSEITNVGRLG